jgi:hypothetical protein
VVVLGLLSEEIEYEARRRRCGNCLIVVGLSTAKKSRAKGDDEHEHEDDCD